MTKKKGAPDAQAMALARRIKQVRTMNKLTQKEFADRIQAVSDGTVSRGAVGNWELGEPPGRDNLRHISEVFGIDHNWLASAKGRAPVPLHEQSPPLTISPRRGTTTPGYRLGFGEGDAEETAALHAEGRVHVPEGEIPQVSARLGMGSAADADTIQIPFGNGSIAALPVVATWKIPEGVLRRRMAGSLQNVHIIECEGDSMEPRIHDGDFVFIDTARRVPSPPGIFALNDGFGQTLKRLEIVPNTEPVKVMIIPENPKHERYERTLEEVSIIGRYLCRLTMD